MIVGLGTDLVESNRVLRELAHGPWLAGDGVFTPEEIEYCSLGKQPGRRYAACFAAKEATLKALGTPVTDLGMFREVEVKPGGRTEHEIVLHNRLQAIASKLGAKRINLSIAATRRRVSAMVILES